MIEYLNVSLTALKRALTLQLSSQDYEECVRNEQGTDSFDASVFNLSVDTPNAQYQRAVKIISSLQYLFQRLLAAGEEVSLDNDSNESGCILEVAQMTATRTLFKQLAVLCGGSERDRNRAIVIKGMADILEDFLKHFTPAVLRQTKEFKSIIAALEIKPNARVETNIIEKIRLEIELFCDLQQALNNLDVLLAHSSCDESSSLTISLKNPTGFECAKSMHEECQGAMITVTMLINQLN